MYNISQDKMIACKNDCVNWIRTYFKENSTNGTAVVGISGGKDSSVVAALCTEALGAERVMGVLMPQGEQSDIEDALTLVKFLKIPFMVINIENAANVLFDSIFLELKQNGKEISNNTLINLPARLRMTTLFGVSQSINGRVANTCNFSENWVGYTTLFGDGAGQFSPLGCLTVQEVKNLGKILGLPTNLIEKTPSDGLCGQTDEDKLGFTYDVLDTYLRTGVCKDLAAKDKIDNLHRLNSFKLDSMPEFYINFPILL